MKINKKTYDYIICGAGSAGCIIANRLVQLASSININTNKHHQNDKILKILLIEAGNSNDYKNIFTRIPVGYYKTQMNQDYDWCYETSPISELNHRILQYPRGRIMGGSSNTNGMLWVRGQSTDFDNWYKLTQDEKWSSINCLKRFERIENDIDLSIQSRCEMDQTDQGIQAFINSAKEMLPNKNMMKKKNNNNILLGALEGANDSHLQKGFGMLPVSINSNGLRSSSSSAFIYQEQLHENNIHLDIMPNTNVKRLLFNTDTDGRGDDDDDDNNNKIRCIGVECITSNNNNKNKNDIEQIYINNSKNSIGEIILSMGTINTPFLLLQSGIGDRKEIKDKNALIKHLPHVGKNMQDHCQIKAAFKTIIPTLNDRVNSYIGMVQMGLDFIFRRKGPLTMSPTPACAFVNNLELGTNENNNNNEGEGEPPNLQLLYGPWTSRSRTMKEYQLFRLLDTFSAAAMTAVQLQPTSTGSITINNNNNNTSTENAPNIQPNFLSTKDDQEQAIQNILYMLHVCSTKSMQSVIDVKQAIASEANSMSVNTKDKKNQRKDESFTNLLNDFLKNKQMVQEDKERLLQYAKNNGTTIYHPTSTCRMGINEETAVVDSNLKVFGLDNLYIADASIMPNIVSGNTNAATMMIAQTASEMISERYYKKVSDNGDNNNNNHIHNQQQRRGYSTTTTVPRNNHNNLALGFDFGTESVRSAIVCTETGTLLGSAVSKYNSSQITASHQTNLGIQNIQPHMVLQNSNDWIESAKIACKQVVSETNIDVDNIIGIGTCFTSCTPLPCKANGTPLHTLDKFKDRPHAWPKLWKHQAATEAIELTKIIKGTTDDDDKHTWLNVQYGGSIGAEWLHPKALEIFKHDKEVFNETELYIDAGDWFVNQLIHNDTSNNNNVTRSACQAGFKGCYLSGNNKNNIDINNKKNGYFPSSSLWNKAYDTFGTLLSEKYENIGKVESPGSVAGDLSLKCANGFGLKEGIPVAVSTIDAHCGVPGVGVGTSGTLTMIMGTSGCYMLNIDHDQITYDTLIKGCLGRVQDGILPTKLGLEMGQSAMGDLFAWLASITNTSVNELEKSAWAHVDYNSSTTRPICLDWFNGNRSPHNIGGLKGGIMSLDLATTPGSLYLAIADGLALGGRDMVKNFQDAGIHVDKYVAAGGLPHVAPLLMQRFADAMQHPIYITETKESGAVGAAIFGAIAGNAFDNVHDAVAIMSLPALEKHGRVVEPNLGREVKLYWDNMQEQYYRLGRLEMELYGGRI